MSSPDISPAKPRAEMCDECATQLEAGDATVLPGLGRFHDECLQPCGCGWMWPWSLVNSGEVILRCSGCARQSVPLGAGGECA